MKTTTAAVCPHEVNILELNSVFIRTFKRFDLSWCVVNFEASYYHILSAKKEDL